jgi:hypothetical protein
MARLRQKGAASGGPQAPQTLWERAGARTGKGAEALFDRLDAQNAQSVRDAAQAALTLERLAAQIRAGAWSAEIAEAVAAARAALDQQ